MRLVILIVLGLIALVDRSRSQSSTFYGQPSGSSGIDIREQTWVYENLLNDTLADIAAVSRKSFTPLVSIPENLTYNDFDNATKIVWKRFDIKNLHPKDTLQLWYNAGAHAILSVYNNKGNLIAKGGLFAGGGAGAGTMPLTVLPNSESRFYVRAIDYVRVFSYPSDILYTPEGYSTFLAQEVIQVKWISIAISMIAGCLLLMGLFTLFQYYLNRDLTYLYYAIYTFVSLAWIVKMVDYRLFLGLAPATFPQLTHPCLASLSFSVSFFYGLFLSKLLDLRIRQPRIWRLVIAVMTLLLLQQLMSLIEIFTGLWLTDNAYYLLCDLSGVVTGLILMLSIYKSNSSLRSYLLAGSISLFIVSIAPIHSLFLFPDASELEKTFISYPPFFMALGLLIELFFFSLALAYRNRLTELENKTMHASYTRQLETDLMKQTQEIQTQNLLLEQQHIRQLETEFEQKLASTEMTALRAQMNPHFIFNCLNSIKLYTLQNDAEKASDYLNKFSKLIRLVLENSRSELVTLQNELDALRLYIELEAMRFKEKVRFNIIANEIDQRYLCIPPLLLQPYVENAIWHGLMHKPEGGLIEIEVTQTDENLLTIAIEDSGIGRARSAELESRSTEKHKSFGMQVTADRIRMINQLYNIRTDVQIVDLVDSFGEPCGTRVILKIPV
ncbi:sensor histidine kinase [Dyadobacter arcticus]|uniref:Sensor histidine kinase YesM n=1 Tax=Dyadobacter arcticus TaxID=1078754 RepID=A0ABX0UJV0_9BACT|nr:histidine kinase [Dyadobacter arcticus]NIJ52364.1 sensor histidine kinase YesM [Dyadobacter arcticus]